VIVGTDIVKTFKVGEVSPHGYAARKSLTANSIVRIGRKDLAMGSFYGIYEYL
jgi:hypothetical protein